MERIKDPGSAITHFIGMIAAIVVALPLLFRASQRQEPVYLVSMAIFIISMILLYAASTIYHSLDISERVNCVLRKIDHAMISVLIAGTYTPVCLIVLDRVTGLILLGCIWGIAIVGIIIKLVWIQCPKWFSSALYITMGWLCVLTFGKLLNNLSREAFLWLLTGGIIYTIGGVIYGLKLPVFNAKHKYFGSHEIFHLFVMGGSACHIVFMYEFVVNMALQH